MKRKLLIITMTITTLLTLVGCLDKVAKGDYEVLESIVLDNDAKDTSDKNSVLNVIMTAKTEGVNANRIMFSGGCLIKDKIIYYTSKRGKEDNENWYIDSLKFGEITDKKSLITGFNSINWEDKDIRGRVFQDLDISDEVRIVMNNKGYKFNSKAELEEIKAYEIFINKYGNKDRRLESYLNGTIDLYWIEEERKAVLIDNLEEKYYEISVDAFSNISSEKIGNTEYKRLRILGIENNRIYVSIESKSAYMSEPSIIGYVEENKFIEILSADIGINIDIRGGVIYSNNKILFSGYAEDKNGIWSYDINDKKLAMQIDVSDKTVFNFSLNPTKDKIMLTGQNDEPYMNTMNLATINENLEISNLTNVESSKDPNGTKSISGWSDDGSKFYLWTRLPEKGNDIGGKPIYNSYEVYKILE